MNTRDFAIEKLSKSGSSLKGVSALVTESFEIEAMTATSVNELYRNLASTGAGFASTGGVNDGNGFNSDVHHDCSLSSYDYTANNRKLYGTETSTSPIDVVGYANMKKEVQRLLDIYKTASGGIVGHTVRGSMHVHNTVAYTSDFDSVKLDVKSIYDNVARFLLKYMGTLKWLVMTDKHGARGVRGSSYGDQFTSDSLFSWWNNYSENTTSNDSFTKLTSLGRQSCFRVYSREHVHYENRLCDCTFNATHIAMWLTINKAITLFAIDFTRNGFTFPLTDSNVEATRDLMRQHKYGFNRVNRDSISVQYKEMVSYLAKYLKVLNSLEVIEVMDKLIKYPIPQYLVEHDVEEDLWNMEIIEKVFNTRNRASDDTLRDKFMHSVKSMSCPFAESLNEYLDNMALHLDVEVKKVKSLYQMFKRENVDIEFLGGRLVYLGD
jgi:hypothetical protein